MSCAVISVSLYFLYVAGGGVGMSSPPTIGDVLQAIENAIFAFLQALATEIGNQASNLAKLVVAGIAVGAIVYVGSRAMDVIRRLLTGFRLPIGF
jgi:uncharacterized BrkB/YihY/UPF0761 family membrane protein